MRFLKNSAGTHFAKDALGNFILVDEEHTAGFNPCGTPCDCTWQPSTFTCAEYIAKCNGTGGPVTFGGNSALESCGNQPCSVMVPVEPYVVDTGPGCFAYDQEQGTGYWALPYYSSGNATRARLVYCKTTGTNIPGTTYPMTAGKWYWHMTINIKSADGTCVPTYGKGGYGRANVALAVSGTIVASTKSVIATDLVYGGDTFGCNDFSPTFSIA